MTGLPADVVRVETATRPLDAEVTVPGSKSITNRALVCAAMAEGASVLRGALDADDTQAMAGSLRALGVRIDHDAEAAMFTVHGCNGLPAQSDATIDARQSGTTARFLLPVVAALPGAFRVDGSEQLRRRPVGALLDAISALGARAEGSGDGGRSLPALVGGGFTGATVAVPGDVTSQFLSGLMLSGALAPAGLVIDVTTSLVSRPYVDMTAVVMADFGARAEITDDGRRIAIEPGGYRSVATFEVEPDASAASYFLGAPLVAGGEVTVRGLRRPSVQGDARFVDVLARMGATVEDVTDGTRVTAGTEMHGIDVDLRDMPDLALTVAALAVFADRPTTVRGVAIIREHESDRIAVVGSELAKLGVRVDQFDDGFTVHPPRAADVLPNRLSSHDDHRVAMAFSLIGLRVPGIEIEGAGSVAKTFPTFWETLGTLTRLPSR